MAKLIILMLFFTVAGIDNLSAQHKNDKNAVATAKTEARKFKLNKIFLMGWRMKKLSTSDHFKPNFNTTYRKSNAVKQL